MGNKWEEKIPPAAFRIFAIRQLLLNLILGLFPWFPRTGCRNGLVHSLSVSGCTVSAAWVEIRTLFYSGTPAPKDPAITLQQQSSARAALQGW